MLRETREKLVEAFRAQVADLVIGPPEIADVEVLVDVSPWPRLASY
jgi:hypothetical protein